jgi:hypothetical protein
MKILHGCHVVHILTPIPPELAKHALSDYLVPSFLDLTLSDVRHLTSLFV